MANIKVNEVNPAGSEWFFDSESFMNELDNHQLDSVLGGGFSNLSVPTPQASDYDLCPQTVDNCYTIFELSCG